MSEPRVIGLLATQDRPALAHRAAHLFLEQEYAGPKTLLVFDDGTKPFRVCEALRDVEIVRHERVSLPVKRNRMVRHVNDPDAIYVVWDDDDYHGPLRIRRQVAALETAQNADACLLRPFLFYNQVTRAQVWRCSGRTPDASLAFRWAFWEARPWDETIDPGSGWRMIANRPTSKLVYLDGVEDYVVVWHGKHRFTAPPNTHEQNWAPTTFDAAWAEDKLQLRDC